MINYNDCITIYKKDQKRLLCITNYGNLIIMKSVTCKKCQKSGLIWKQSKKGNWYLAVEQEWQGDMTGAIKYFYPAHDCENQITTNKKRIEELEILITDLEQFVDYSKKHPESIIPGFLQKKETELKLAKTELSKLIA